MSPRAVRGVSALAAFAALVWLVPLFHVVPLEATRQQSAAIDFDPVAVVEKSWHDLLPGSGLEAVDAADLQSALVLDFADASSRLGHRLGLSGSVSWFVRGRGRIVAVEDHAVSITMGDDESADIVIELGPVFGNAIRDGSGLFDVSDFANAQDFNALSAEINRRVEEEVLPVLVANAAVGRELRFAGGVAMSDTAAVPESLYLVPVYVEFP